MRPPGHQIFSLARWQRVLALAFALASTPAAVAASLLFTENPAEQHEYALHEVLPDAFGRGEFTFELWVLLDKTFPPGPCTVDTVSQLQEWCSADVEPYSSGDWWYRGNFLLDGHNNGSCFCDGTFSLQFYGGGRLRWLLGDGEDPGAGGNWSVGAFPATTTPTLLDGLWHQVTLVRRWEAQTAARLELWIDGSLIATETSPGRRDLHDYWDTWSGFPAGQEGWFWGAEKQAAIGVLQQYEDFKGLIDEIRFWSRAKTPDEIPANYNRAVSGNEAGLVGWLPFNEGSGNATCDPTTPEFCMTLFPPAAGSLWSPADAPLADAPGPGEVPDGNRVTGAPLLLDKEPPGTVVLAWSPSCGSQADDFAIYSGSIGAFQTRDIETCSTSGATAWSISAGTESRFFLVVPRNAETEGGYGFDRAGFPRVPAKNACAATSIDGC